MSDHSNDSSTPSSSTPSLSPAIERALRAALDASTQAIVVLGRGDTIVLSNPAAARLGVSLDNLVAEIGPRREEMRARKRDGQPATESIDVVRHDTLGRPRRFALDCVMREGLDVVTIRDVTEQRLLDAEVRQLRRVDAVGNLAASVLHDFNNLMTPIVCSSALLERAVANQDHAAELAREIREAAERAAELLRRVLSFARRSSAGATRVSVAGSITELRSLLERVAGVGVKLSFDLGDDADEAIIDREQLDHALLNLVANARDAMPNGGKLTLHTACLAINDDEDTDSGEETPAQSFVAITISDTGVGMTPEVRERIFERFFTTKDEGRGTGLGLANARRFANESGGFLTVHSEPKVGTTIVLYVPRAEPRVRSTPISKVTADVVGGNESVLVVDDDPLVRSAVVAVLEAQGYRVLDAASGEEALAFMEARGKPVDLLVVDIVLSGMNGRELARRAQTIHPTKVLFTSGHTPGVLECHGFDEDDKRLLRKAFTPRALCTKVREMLDDATDVAECG
jgi:signal transduction histidine kinase